MKNIQCCELYKTFPKKEIGKGSQSTIYTIDGYKEYAIKVIPLLTKKKNIGAWGKPLMGGGITFDELKTVFNRMKILHKNKIGPNVYCYEECNGSKGHVGIITMDRIIGDTMLNIVKHRTRVKNLSELPDYLNEIEKKWFNKLKHTTNKLIFQGRESLSDFHLDNIMYGYLANDKTKTKKYWVVDF